MSTLNFDATQVAPDTGISPAPRGYYKVVAIKSELKPTKDGAGELIAFNTQIIAGPFQGKNIAFNLNWKNKSATAQNIGHGQLSAICHATGVLGLQDTQQLHNIPFGLEVDVTDDGKYNDVKSFMHVDKVDTMPPLPPKEVKVGLPTGAAPAPFAAAPPAAFAPQPFAAPAPQAWQQPQAQPPAFAPTAAPQAAPTAPQVATFPSSVQAPGVANPPPTAAPVVAQQQPAPTQEVPAWILAQQQAAAAQQPAS